MNEERLSELLSKPADMNLNLVMDNIENVQQVMYSLCDKEDKTQPALLKIGTVFQVFFIDTLLKKKDLKKLTQDDWRQLAEKVSKNAMIEDQSYCELVFLLYADYVDYSIEGLRLLRVPEENLVSIKEMSDTIRKNTELLKANELKEIAYVEACLWLSFEAMIKLLSSLLGIAGGTEGTRLAQAVSQLAFEYGRYVLFKKEHALLKRYLENQYELDDKLQADYEEYIKEIELQAKQFRVLIERAFSTDIQMSLSDSIELARAIGVPEEELLTTEEDIDAFFLD